MARLLVENLDPTITESHLYKAFSPYGFVVAITLMRDAALRSRGFAYLLFHDSDSAKGARKALNGVTLGTKPIIVGDVRNEVEFAEAMHGPQFEDKHLKRIQNYQKSNVYVENLEESVDDEFLRMRFSMYGNVMFAKVMRDAKGCSEGFGFVCFSSPEEAAKAGAEERGARNVWQSDFCHSRPQPFMSR